MTQERTLGRVGGVCAMLGAALAVGAAMLGPMGLDSQDMPAVLQAFAADTGKLHLHGLGVSLGTLLLLGGFVGLQRRLPAGSAGAWARLGLAGAVVMTVIHLLGAMMGGSVMPALAELYAMAPPDQAAASLQAGEAFFAFYEALLAPTFLTLAAAVLPFGIALLQTDDHPRWLGWAAVVTGAWSAAGGVAFVFAGPMGAADIMNTWVPGLMLSMVWVFIAGVFMWRSAADLERRRTPEPASA